MALFASSGIIAPIHDWVRGRGPKHLPHTLEVPRAHAGNRRNNGIVVCGRDVPLGRIVQRAAYRDGVEARHAGGDREIERRRGLLEIFALTLEPSLKRGHVPGPGAGGPR